MNVDVWFSGSDNAFGLIILFSFIFAGLIWYWLRRVKWL